jgi:alkanesulfonate monooxygenase SsuD/methylene tetrahydromethanopterin reductase-like flavin-dependent oxidoreductase (luciferase family)
MHKHLVSLRKSTLKDQGKVSMTDSNLIGTPAEIVDKAHALIAAGVTHFLGLYFAADSVSDLKDQMQLFAEDVIPKL